MQLRADPGEGNFPLRSDPCLNPPLLSDCRGFEVIDMALLSVIRRWHLRGELSIQEIARRTGLSWNTIRKYLRSDEIEPCFVRNVILAVSELVLALLPRCLNECGLTTRETMEENSEYNGRHPVRRADRDNTVGSIETNVANDFMVAVGDYSSVTRRFANRGAPQTVVIGRSLTHRSGANGSPCR